MESASRQHLNVLTIIPDSEVRSLIKLTLENDGHSVLESRASLQDAGELIDRPGLDVVVLECGKTTADVQQVRQLLKCSAKDRVVLVSAREQVALRKEARDMGIRTFLMKPVSPSEVKSAVAEVRRTKNEEPSIAKHSDSAWWALYTTHRHEKAVARMLQAKDFNVFLPLYTSLRRWTDRDKMLNLPLFPGYVFVRGGLNRRLEIMTTPGVQMILFYGERVALIPEAEIDAIQKMLEEPYHAEPYAYLKCGERVRVKRGSLQGIEGILVRKKNLFRLVISVDILARSVAVEIDAADLEPIGDRTELGSPRFAKALEIQCPTERSLRTA